MAKSKQPKRSQSAAAADKVAEAKQPPAPAKGAGKPAANGAKVADPKSEHDLLEEIRAGYAKVAKIEGEIADLKGRAKVRREALATANRELRFLLAGQRALPFGKTPKVEVLDTVDPPASGKPGEALPVGDWFEVREIGSDRHVANFPAGHPHLDDFRKRAKDFIVRKLPEPPHVARSTKSAKAGDVVEAKLPA